MKTIAPLVATIGVLLVCEIDGERHVEGTYMKFCCCNSTRSAFEDCCTKAESYILPGPFYGDSCTTEFVKYCTSENKSTSNSASVQKICCKRQDCSNKTPTQHNISFNWNERRFWPKRAPNEWNLTQGKLFLIMATQGCLNNKIKPTSVTLVRYRYPVHTDLETYKKKFVHGFYLPAAYLVMKKENHDILTVVSDSFKHLWPTVCICVAWTLISGIIIWLLDRRKNSVQFPPTFLEGVREGAWWAVVTMTTVGYGDKSPKSLLARIYAAAWMIIGIIILSIFTAEVSSALTTKEIKRQDSVIDLNIGVPIGGKQFFKRQFIGASIQVFNSTKELEEHLARGSGSNRIVLHTCKASSGADDNKQIVKGLGPHIVGIKLVKNNFHQKNDEKNLVECVKGKVRRYLNYNGPNLDDDDGETEEKCDIEKRNHSKMREFQPFDVSAIIMYASAGLVAGAFAVGILCDSIRSHGRKTNTEVDVDVSGSVKINTVEEPIELLVAKERGDEINKM